MASPALQPLNAGESEWLQSNLQLASRLVETYTGQSSGLPSLSLLGATLVAWSRAPEDAREDVNVVVNALGLVFGQHLVNALDLRWVVASDDKGTDIAVHGYPGDILAYPTNATAKRVVAQDYNFFATLFDDLVRDISQARRAWQ